MKTNAIHHYLRPEHFRNFRGIIDSAVVDEAECKYPTDKRIRKIPFVTHFYCLLIGIITKAKSLKEAIFHFHLLTSGQDRLPARFDKSALSRKNKNRSLEPFLHVFKKVVELAKVELPRLIQPLFQDVQIFDGTFVNLIESLYTLFGGCPNQSHKKNTRASVVVCYSAVSQIPCNFAFGKSNVYEPRKAKRMVSKRKPKEKPTLYIFDLLYSSHDFLTTLIKRGHYFVCRLPVNVTPPRKIASCSRKHYDWLVQPFQSPDKQFKQSLRAVRVKGKEGKYYWYLTNLIDPILFPKEKIAAIYKWRWAIEVFFNDLKHVMKMQQFISRTANGIHIQIIMAMVVYVIIRLLIKRASDVNKIAYEQFCFRNCAMIFFAMICYPISNSRASPVDNLLDYIFRFGIYKNKFESLHSKSMNLYC